MNTGWNGTGKRISIKDTRGIINAILDGKIDEKNVGVTPYLNLTYPKHIDGVDSSILDPRNTYMDKSLWENKAKKLSKMFIDNFHKFESNPECLSLVPFGPKLED